ncbi:unnamed protein product [Cuscuta campestris]|uniref:Uncharacterized protein n=1 Tax=Cuscuta campestris TaxID=132261 RepID=A0A484KYN0_9ASTE|nr:unnamed protein product [Cuscuta campestris]
MEAENPNVGEENVAQVEEPTQLPRPVSFIVDIVPFQRDDHFVGLTPLLPSRLDNIAATYQPVMDAIIGSPMNKAGRVSMIYVHFPRDEGLWFQVDAARSSFIEGVTPAAFERFLERLFRDGCVSGEDNGLRSFDEHISGMLDNNNYVYVVGQFAIGDVGGYIEEKVKVSQYQVNTQIALYQICIALANKWNIH